jgi:N-methylhydantoinase B
MRIDGFDAPIDFHAKLTIDDEAIHLDFAGTSGVSRYGVNCPLCYTQAYTSFGIKCLVAPRLANNAAILHRIRVTAPENTIVNALPPAPVTGRSLIGQMLPDVAFGCFDKAMPGRAPAEGTAASWSLRIGGGPGLTGKADGAVTSFMSQSYQSGGMGAHPNQDGLSATPYPSGVKAIAIEITEAMTPLVVWRKELRADSGGAGMRRGGLGQIMEVSSREQAPFALYAKFDRVDNPPRGRGGGRDGAAGKLSLKSGKALSAKGTQLVPPGDRLHVEMPGGGGLGDPAKRDPQDVLADVSDGLVSREAAHALYKVAIGADMKLDEAGTRALRK